MTSQAEGNTAGALATLQRRPMRLCWGGMANVPLPGLSDFFPLQQRFRGDKDALMSGILIQMWIPFQKSEVFVTAELIFEGDKMNFLPFCHTHVPLMEERRRPPYSAAIFSLPESVPIIHPPTLDGSGFDYIPPPRLIGLQARRSRPVLEEKNEAESGNFITIVFPNRDNRKGNAWHD